jgi:hypothetical protein
MTNCLSYLESLKFNSSTVGHTKLMKRLERMSRSHSESYIHEMTMARGKRRMLLRHLLAKKTKNLKNQQNGLILPSLMSLTLINC